MDGAGLPLFRFEFSRFSTILAKAAGLSGSRFAKWFALLILQFIRELSAFRIFSLSSFGF